MKRVENGTESLMWTAKKEMSGICNHAANTHTWSGREDETCGESSRRQSHVNTRVGDADTHVTVWAGKSMQSFSKGNMSLEWRRKAEVTECGGRGDVMCCPIGSEMWLCMTYKQRKTNENPFKLYTRCPRRNVPDFGRVFLMLKYTDITQNTYVQSWTVTEIMAREVWNFDSCYTLVDYQIHIKTGRNMWFL